MIAAVPANESWKPTSQASSGRHASIAAAVTASEVQTWLGRPRLAAGMARPPLGAARIAAGVGPPAAAESPKRHKTGQGGWCWVNGGWGALELRAAMAPLCPL